ncbi:MAG: HAD family hydrolase [Erysipelotrichaceae bacterium]
MAKFKLILFDLDGTLIHLDAQNFERDYTKLIISYFSQWLDATMVQDTFARALKTMVEVEDNRTNKEKFYSCFAGNDKISLSEIMAKEADFYHQHFDKLKPYIKENTNMSHAIAILKEKQFPMAIATNPLFPRIATLSRLKWGNYHKEDFSLITTFEDCHFTKFHKKYYEIDILKRLNLKAEDCLMVGNNTVEDGLASSLGIQTIIITDDIIDQANQYQVTKMTSQEFLEYVRKL